MVQIGRPRITAATGPQAHSECGTVDVTGQTHPPRDVGPGRLVLAVGLLHTDLAKSDPATEVQRACAPLPVCTPCPIDSRCPLYPQATGKEAQTFARYDMTTHHRTTRRRARALARAHLRTRVRKCARAQVRFTRARARVRACARARAQVRASVGAQGRTALRT